MKITPPLEFHLRELLAIAHHAATHPEINIDPRVQEFLTRYGVLPTTLNGCPVIAIVPRMLRGPLAAKTLDTGRFIVLVKREHPDAPFVTALWSTSCGDSWDCGTYLGTLTDGMASLLERAQLVTEPPHDKGSAPPAGFTRYQVEIDVHDDIDSSDLLGQLQEMSIALIPDELTEEAPDSEALVETIQDRVSVQAMRG